MYVIYQVIDPATGEVVRYTSDLADQVAELRAVRQMTARGQLAGLGSFHRHRELKPAPVDEEGQLWRLFGGGGV